MVGLNEALDEILKKYNLEYIEISFKRKYGRLVMCVEVRPGIMPERIYEFEEDLKKVVKILKKEMKTILKSVRQ